MQTQRSINLDRGWRFGTGSFNPMLDIVAQHFHAGDAPRIVDLPHDYMIESDVSADAPAGAASGFYTAGPAYYTRLVDIPAAWAGQEVFLQLDGAMMNATVEVNGSRAALQHNGYIPFAVRLTPYLTFGEENRITVNLNPSMQPNSRWYTGRGCSAACGWYTAPSCIWPRTASLPGPAAWTGRTVRLPSPTCRPKWMCATKPANRAWPRWKSGSRRKLAARPWPAAPRYCRSTPARPPWPTCALCWKNRRCGRPGRRTSTACTPG